MGREIQNTPNAERPHILFLGRCNSGKSSLMNALVGQQVAITSPLEGTTTDPVKKAFELSGVGAVLMIDTPGLDDFSVLGAERVGRSRAMIDGADVAVVLLSADVSDMEIELIESLRKRDVPIVAVINKCDLIQDRSSALASVTQKTGLAALFVSSLTGEGVELLRGAIAAQVKSDERLITEGFCEAGDVVLLVMPQDAQAPKGRLIKPQVQTIRELLDRGCVALCSTAEQLPSALASMAAPPKLIITDSQVFDRVYACKPEASVLTSFSVLFARYKGDIREFVEGAKAISKLSENSRVLIAEACAHAPQSEDIGRVKLPRMLRRRVGEGLTIDVVGGNDFPQDLTSYDLIIHCGACMFNRRHVLSRVARAVEQQIPITNYGVAIAALQGILDKVKTE